jgi:uncharacterized protein YgiM (DUF1202 family)
MSQFTRNTIALVATLVVLIALGAGAGELAKHTSSSNGTTKTTQTNVAPIDYKGQEGKTVLELLQAGHTVKTVDSSYGTYVQSIDGTASGDNSAWLYYVNDQPGLDAADKTTTHDTDSIEWRYESF